MDIEETLTIEDAKKEESSEKDIDLKKEIEEEKDPPNPEEENNLSEMELLILYAFSGVSHEGFKKEYEDSVVRSIVYAKFGEENYENKLSDAKEHFLKLYDTDMLRIRYGNYSDYTEVTEQGKRHLERSDIGDIYKAILDKSRKKLLDKIEWHIPLLLIQETGMVLPDSRYEKAYYELKRYGIILYYKENNNERVRTNPFFFEKNENMENVFENIKYKIKNEIINGLKDLLKSTKKELLFKVFAGDLIRRQSTNTDYPDEWETPGKIVGKNAEFFSKLYVYAINGKIIDVFKIGEVLKEMVQEEEVIKTIYPDQDSLIANENWSYNEWRELFKKFNERNLEKYRNFILPSLDGKVVIPEFWKEKIIDRFYGEYDRYLEFLEYVTKSEELDKSNIKFSDLVISSKEICSIPSDAEKFLKEYFKEIHSRINKKKDYEDLKIHFEKPVEGFLEENLSEDDLKTYHLLGLLNDFKSLKDGKGTIIERFFSDESLARLEHIYFFNSEDESTYLTKQALSETISSTIERIYSRERFEEDLKEELHKSFSSLDKKEKALVYLIIMPESLDTGIKIHVKTTFSSQIIDTVGGERFEDLKKLFYIVKTEKGFESVVKEHVNGVFDEMSLDELPVILSGKTKEEMEKQVDDVFKTKKPSYFYRLFEGELTENETRELQKTGMIFSDGRNNPVLHPAMKRILKENWKKYWHSLEHLSGENVIKEYESPEEIGLVMKCGVDEYRIRGAPYVRMTSFRNKEIVYEMLDKNLNVTKGGLKDGEMDLGHTIFVSEELDLSKFDFREEQGREALSTGLSFLDLQNGYLISANLNSHEISQIIETNTGVKIHIPNEYFSLLEDIRKELEERKREEDFEKVKKELEEKTKEEKQEHGEIEKIDELWEKIFLEEEEMLFFDPDKYLNGKLKTFTFLIHGLPGCGKTTLIDMQSSFLKRKIEESGWKTSKYELSLKDILDHRTSPVSYCQSFLLSILYKHKATQGDKGTPAIVVIKDLDAIAEQKMTPTSDIRDGEKVAVILKEFLKEIFEKQGYQIAVFAEATNINRLPEYLLQFFPNRKVVLAPSFDNRKKLFSRVRIERIREKFKQEKKEIVNQLIDIIGLPIQEEHTDILAQHTQGFTYRDLTLLIRDLKQSIKERENPDEKYLVERVKKYDASLPQYLRIEVPKVAWEDVKGLESQKEKVEEALMLDGENQKYERNFSVSPAKGLLFYGVPGTGKTYMAKAIANRCNAYFIHLSPPQIFSKYFGESEQNLKHIFTLAKELATYGGNSIIIFIDELDGFAPSREKMESRPERSVLSVFLSELDGLEELSGITIIGTTNRPWDIDAALIRSGRFDEWIEFKPPNIDTCVDIFYSELTKDSSESLSIKKAKIKSIFEKIEEKIYNEEKTSTQNSMKLDYEDFLVPADLTSFSHRILRKFMMQKEDKDILELIEENLEELIEEKNRRRDWSKKGAQGNNSQ